MLDYSIVSIIIIIFVKLKSVLTAAKLIGAVFAVRTSITAESFLQTATVGLFAAEFVFCAFTIG